MAGEGIEGFVVVAVEVEEAEGRHLALTFVIHDGGHGNPVPQPSPG
jgi:hypothetical protein